MEEDIEEGTGSTDEQRQAYQLYSELPKKLWRLMQLPAHRVQSFEDRFASEAHDPDQAPNSFVLIAPPVMVVAVNDLGLPFSGVEMMHMCCSCFQLTSTCTSCHLQDMEYHAAAMFSARRAIFTVATEPKEWATDHGRDTKCVHQCCLAVFVLLFQTCVLIHTSNKLR
jgi:hypothetical protein